MEGLSSSWEAGRATDRQKDRHAPPQTPTRTPPNQSADRTLPPSPFLPGPLRPAALLSAPPPPPACRPCGLQCHIAASACAVGEGFQPRPPICCVPPGSLCLPFLRPWLLEWNGTLGCPAHLSLPQLSQVAQRGQGWAVCPLAPPLPGQVIHHCQSLSNHDALTCGTCTGGRH